MHAARIVITWALAWAGAFGAGAVSGRVLPADFKLTQIASDCGTPGHYNVSVAWTPTPESSTFALATGNACQLNGRACVKRTPCMINCKPGGRCEAHLSACAQGRGSPCSGSPATAVKTQSIRTGAPRRCF